MSNKLSITFLEDGDRGRAESRDLFTTLLVGRSRSADIRVREADVSGKHFEFVRSASGCSVRVLSRNGMTVDGNAAGEGAVERIRVGTVLGIGDRVTIRVDALPEESAALEEVAPAEKESREGAGFFDGDPELPTSTGTGAPADPPPDDDGAEPETRGDFEEALTEAGDGETQEMKTRIGSMEEISERKRQLDRASVVRRWRFGVVIGLVMLALGVFWYFTGSRRHVTDAEGPFLPDGELDLAETTVYGENGQPEFQLLYARDDRMKVAVSKDSNTVEVVTFLGVDRDVPFHLEFRRWRDVRDMRYSLEDSFERRMRADAAAGFTFERHGAVRPSAEFFEDVFPDFCEFMSLRGIRFVRVEYTRTMKYELWHGVCIYFRRGDTLYQLRREVPEMYWKRAGYRLTGETNFGIYKAFSLSHWDSPGAAGLVSDAISDEDLLAAVKRELVVERTSAWPAVESYIDTLLVRSWADKPTIRKLAFSHYREMLDLMTRFYHERYLAFRTARSNRDEKRMRSVFIDCKTVFGALGRDRRSLLVNNPEVWSCQ